MKELAQNKAFINKDNFLESFLPSKSIQKEERQPQATRLEEGAHPEKVVD